MDIKISLFTYSLFYLTVLYLSSLGLLYVPFNISFLTAEKCKKKQEADCLKASISIKWNLELGKWELCLGKWLISLSFSFFILVNAIAPHILLLVPRVNSLTIRSDNRTYLEKVRFSFVIVLWRHCLFLLPQYDN